MGKAGQGKGRSRTKKAVIGIEGRYDVGPYLWER